MFIFRSQVLLLIFLCVFILGAASKTMSGEAVEKYIQKKIKRNDKVLRINKKNLGDKGLAAIAQSPLVCSIEAAKLQRQLRSLVGERARARERERERAIL